MRHIVMAVAALFVVSVVLVSSATPSAVAGDPKVKILQGAANGTIKPGKIDVKVTKDGVTTTVSRTLPFISSGPISAAQAALGIGAAAERREGADATSGADLPAVDLGASMGSFGCGKRDSAGNTRVNQDCSFRRQAEEDITFNPAEPNNLLAGQNDSRVGFNQCGIDWSTDNGKHWGDMLPPFRQKVNNPAAEEPVAGDMNRHTIQGGPGTLHTYDADSDPTVAFDSQGRAFFSCVAFDVFSNASLLWVSQSPVGAHGSFFFNIAMFGRNFVVAEDNDGTIFHDKEFITADTHTTSPNRDNVYVTWTVFKFACGPNGDQYCRSPIYGSMSTDHARTWSTPELISGASDTLCFFGNFFDPTENPHACNFDQGSDPIALPNGDLVVVFNNGNTPEGNPNGQQLAVKCHPTGSSPAHTAHFNCAAPSKVGDDIITGEPQCNFGRGPEECIPGAFIRTNDFPRIEVNTDNSHIYVVWQDYRNQEFDIQLARSVDGGVTWTQGGTVNPDNGLDHYFPAVDLSETTKDDRVGVSYYRTERVPNENTTPSGGFAPGQPGVQASNSDYVLAGGRNVATPYAFKVVSPVFPPPDGNQAGFNGDYSGLTINKGDEAHPIWSDTRNADPYAPANGLVHDEDVYTDKVGLPDGQAKTSTGKIGKD
jgi:hypothetical protein